MWRASKRFHAAGCKLASCAREQPGPTDASATVGKLGRAAQKGIVFAVFAPLRGPDRRTSPHINEM
jgi:hypothetical protein